MELRLGDLRRKTENEWKRRRWMHCEDEENLKVAKDEKRGNTPSAKIQKGSNLFGIATYNEWTTLDCQNHKPCTGHHNNGEKAEDQKKAGMMGL